MQLRFLTALAVAVMSISTMSSALADDSKSYTEGTVTNVSSVRTKPGQGSWRRLCALTFRGSAITPDVRS